MAVRDQGELFEGGEADDFGNFPRGSWLGDGRVRQFVDDVFGAHGRIGGDVGNADGGFETGGEVGHSASHGTTAARRGRQLKPGQDRKSTRLNSSHGYISYAVFCLKKKNTKPSTDL